MPVITDSGIPVPGHDIIVFVAFFVTIGTLLLQGLTLPMVITRLGCAISGRSSATVRSSVTCSPSR